MAAIKVTPIRPNRPANGADIDIENQSASLNAPTDHWEIENNGSVVLQFYNAHATQAGSITVETPGSVDGNAVADRQMNIAAQRRGRITGPWPVGVYGRKLVIRATDQGELRVIAWRTD